ncbi:hypothetical protein ACFOZ1_06730 [Gracilibacillus marinus]|uniref:Uncharacterized protein n=1 Tax=Gracilibacillus marinus TaxID=630535 RepID=A0ABV8VUB3_9BACI
MLVKFEFKDKYETVSTINNQEIELSDAEVYALFQSDEISYPVDFGGSNSVKFAKIEKSEFNMYRPNEKHLHVTLRELR